MSRCFPFPPPGYERNHILEDLLLLKEAKLKNKKEKRKKRRKNREKEKDGKGEKHGEKKERHKEKKEKRRDKNKDENTGNEKEKNDTSCLEKSTVSNNLEQVSRKNLHPEGCKYDGINSVSVDKFSMLSRGRNGVKPFDPLLASHSPVEAEFVKDLNKRFSEDGNIFRNHFFEKVASKENWEQAGSEIAVVGNPSMDMARVKVDSRQKIIETRNLDVQLHSDESRRKLVAQNHNRVTGGEVEENRRSIYGKFDRAVDGNRDVIIHGKDRDNRNDTNNEKPVKKTEKSKVMEPENVRRIHPFDDTSHIIGNSSPDNENYGKRKGGGINGFLHEIEMRPEKSQIRSILPSTKNGSNVLASRAPSKSSDDLGTQDHECWLINGIVKPQNLPLSHVSDPRSSYRDPGNANEEFNVPTIEDLLTEVSTRPQHPDSKFLSQVLTVPRVGEWFEYDDQEWLFSKKDPPEKPDRELCRLPKEMTTLVWSKPVHIESANVYALPYVIPY